MRDAVAAALGRAWAPAARPSAARAVAAAAPYVELVRFRYHATFVAVAVVACRRALAGDPAALVSAALIPALAALLVVVFYRVERGPAAPSRAGAGGRTGLSRNRYE